IANKQVGLTRGPAAASRRPGLSKSRASPIEDGTSRLGKDYVIDKHPAMAPSFSRGASSASLSNAKLSNKQVGLTRGPAAASRRPGLSKSRASPIEDGTSRLGKDYVLWGARSFMRTNRTPDEWVDWCLARNRIDDELKKYYRAFMTGELP